MFYINVAENIAQGNGFVYNVAAYSSNNMNLKPLNDCMPIYPLFISLLIKLGLNSTLSARLVPVISLALIPFPMYYLTRNLYGRTIAHASTIYLIFLWVLIYCASYAWTEMTFLFFVLMAMLFLSELAVHTEEAVVAVARGTIISFISGVFIGFAYLTRINGTVLLPVAFFVIFFLISPIKDKIKHKLRLFLSLLIGFSLVSGLWWIRNYFIFSSPTYFEALSRFHGPTLKYFLDLPFIYGVGLFPLVLCLPYSLRYLFDKDERKKLLLVVSFPLITSLLLSGWMFIDQRKFSSIYPFLIIIGMKSLFDIAKWMRGRFKPKSMNTVSFKTLMTVLLILFILPQVISDVNYYSSYGSHVTVHVLNHPPMKTVLEKMGTYESIEWIKTNTNQNDVILSDNPWGVYYHTKRNTVWTGKRSSTGQLKYSSFMDAVNRLNISYIILFKDSYRVRREYGGDFVYNLSRGCDVPSNLNIVYNRDDAIIYRCEK